MAYTKSSLPELVDLSITDYCAKGCSFCYRNSTKAGAHAKLEDLELISSELAKAEVFEVAIGGGEPTSHPQFVEVLRAFHSKHICVNFTTRDLEYLYHMDAEILDMASAIGFTVTTLEEYKELQALCDSERGGREWGMRGENYESSRNIVIHMPLGAMSIETMNQIIIYQDTTRTKKGYNWNFPILILDYKETGRGVNGPTYPVDLESLKELIERWRSKVYIGIDTPLAKKIGNDLVKDKITNPIFFTQEEGKFSMFLDAVKMTMAASSYGKPEDFSPFTKEGWIETYRKY